MIMIWLAAGSIEGVTIFKKTRITASNDNFETGFVFG